MDRRTFLKAGLGAMGIPLESELAIARMKEQRFQLEVIASSFEDAVAAHAGGATRLELAVHLEKGGFTPPLDLAKRIVHEVPIPVRVMLRVREGVVLSGSAELQTLIEKLKAITQLKVNGLVLGFTKADHIDLTTLRQLIAVSPSEHYTVHNAIEMTSDPIETLRTLRALPQVDRALVCGCTSFKPGGRETLVKQIERLKAYRTVWEDKERRLLVNGLRIDQINQVQREVGVREFHLGEQVRTPEKIFPLGKVDVDKVREVVALLSRPY